jgi:TrmH family RNA methyltransferase
MLSKSQIKLITSLQQKKYRNKLQLFIVEGVKSVEEFLASNYVVETIFYTSDYSGNLPENKSELITNTELKKN